MLFLLLNNFFNTLPTFAIDYYFQVLIPILYFTDFTIDTAAGAGLTGSKVARRIGDVDEFEFKTIGENHNQGVSSLASQNLEVKKKSRE